MYFVGISYFRYRHAYVVCYIVISVTSHLPPNTVTIIMLSPMTVALMAILSQGLCSPAERLWSLPSASCVPIQSCLIIFLGYISLLFYRMVMKGSHHKATIKYIMFQGYIMCSVAKLYCTEQLSNVLLGLYKIRGEFCMLWMVHS